MKYTFQLFDNNNKKFSEKELDLKDREMAVKVANFLRKYFAKKVNIIYNNDAADSKKFCTIITI